MKEINELLKSFYKFGELKDKFRISPTNINLYSQVKDSTEELIKEISELLRNNNVSREDKEALISLKYYYLYEKEDCCKVYHYESHNIDKARKHFKESIKFIKIAIRKGKEAIKALKSEGLITMNKDIKVWEFYLKNALISGNLIEARNNWDKKNFIAALDQYRESAKQYKELISFIEKNNLEYIYERITKGNYLGMMANASNAMIGYLIEKEAHKEISFNKILKIFEYAYEAYKYSKEAFKVNPEWEQYTNGEQKVLKNIKTSLNLLPIKMWKRLYIEFEDESDFLKIMKSTDLEKFKSIYSDININKSSKINLLLVGAPYVIFIGIILSVAFTKKLSIYEGIVCMLILEVVYIIVEAFHLRFSEKVTEENFINLIKVALKFQKEVIEFIFKKDFKIM